MVSDRAGDGIVFSRVSGADRRRYVCSIHKQTRYCYCCEYITPVTELSRASAAAPAQSEGGSGGKGERGGPERDAFGIYTGHGPWAPFAFTKINGRNGGRSITLATPAVGYARPAAHIHLLNRTRRARRDRRVRSAACGVRGRTWAAGGCEPVAIACRWAELGGRDQRGAKQAVCVARRTGRVVISTRPLPNAQCSRPRPRIQRDDDGYYDGRVRRKCPPTARRESRRTFCAA